MARKPREHTEASTEKLASGDRAAKTQDEALDLATFLVKASLARMSGILWLWQQELEVVSTACRAIFADSNFAMLSEKIVIDGILHCHREFKRLRDIEGQRFQDALDRLSANTTSQSFRTPRSNKRRWRVKP